MKQMHFTKEERETIFNHDPIEKRWHIYSNYPPDIRKIIERAEVIETTKDEQGRLIDVHATASSGQIRIYHDK